MGKILFIFYSLLERTAEYPLDIKAAMYRILEGDIPSRYSIAGCQFQIVNCEFESCKFGISNWEYIHMKIGNFFFIDHDLIFANLISP